MSGRRSQFETLKNLRSRHRDAQRARLAEAMRAQEQLAAQWQNVADEISVAKAHQRDVRTGEFDVTTLLENERYEIVLKAQQAAIAKQIEVVNAETQRRREDLALANQQVRVVEKLEQRRQQELQKIQNRREQARLDEVATHQFLRNNVNEPHSS